MICCVTSSLLSGLFTDVISTEKLYLWHSSFALGGDFSVAFKLHCLGMSQLGSKFMLHSMRRMTLTIHADSMTSSDDDWR
jgi:hypothetical protein